MTRLFGVTPSPVAGITGMQFQASLLK